MMSSNRTPREAGHTTWHQLSRTCTYEELRGDWFSHRDAERVRARAVAQLEKLGYRVRLDAA
ncbi:MAG TPA: hypothetical protein VIK38_11390 [Coriobacteriia bacterium]